MSTQVIKEKVLEFRKQNCTAYFVKNYKVIVKYVVVNYKHGGPHMAMFIKNMNKLSIFVPDTQDYLDTRVKIFICGRN